MLAFRVDGTGTASILEGAFDATLTDNGTGDYTLTFTKAFARVPVVIFGGAVDDALMCEIDAVSVSAVRFKIFDADGTTATDADFHVMVLGWDGLDQY